MLVLRVTILKHVGKNIFAGWCWVNVYNENIYMLIMNLSSGWPEGRAGDGEEDEEEE